MMSDDRPPGTLRLEISPDNPNTVDYSEDLFASGEWERRGGRKQTETFARFFHRHIRVPYTGEFSVLDVGCALGDAVKIWKRRYPAARLTGYDISPTAIDRATRDYGSIATFRQGSFEEIRGSYDVVFCSNVLEHFEQHVAIASHLLSHCRTLYVMTPYAEMEGGRPLTPRPGGIHVATFLEDSFDALKENLAAKIETRVIRCPKAWGPSIPGEILWHLRYFLGLINPPSPLRRQIIYTISNTGNPRSAIDG
ncbi:MAG: class I SAM-dependent methyltransferase, partial [Ignavibacteria bacterium]|nr:class I SAM-dependent methyltransferase [Ignavibacteria bacterium]